MPVPPLERFEQLLEAWCNYLAHNCGRSPSTVSKYRGHLARMGQWFAAPPEDPKLAPAGRDPMAALPADLDCFTGLYAHSLGLKPRARRPVVSAVRGFYGWATAKHLIESNPAALLQQPQAGKPLPTPTSLDNAARLLMAPDITLFQGVRDAAIIAVLIGCGLRISGLVRLNESALLWYHDEKGAERLALRVREKGDKERVVPVPIEAALLVRAYLGHDELAAVDRTLPDGDRVLWVSTRNQTCPPHLYHGERRRLAVRTIQQALERYGTRAGVPAGQRNPHALRHLFGTELAESDVPTLQAQALLGHEDPKSTEIYTHLAHRKLVTTVDRANPLAKIRAPLVETLRGVGRTIHAAQAGASVRPGGTQKPKSTGRPPA